MTSNVSTRDASAAPLHDVLDWCLLPIQHFSNPPQATGNALELVEHLQELAGGGVAEVVGGRFSVSISEKRLLQENSIRQLPEKRPVLVARSTKGPLDPLLAHTLLAAADDSESRLRRQLGSH